MKFRLGNPRVFLFFAAVLTLFFVLGRDSNPPQPAEIGKPSSGAFRTLNNWAAQRDYPFEQGKDRPFFRAWEKTKRFRKAGATQKSGEPWSPIGPANLGGRTLVLAFDPVDPNIMFAGSASGGLWRSESGGLGTHAWERVETGFPILGVAAIAINPQNRQEMVIGTGEVYGYSPTTPGTGNRLTRGSYGMGILKSDDGGQSWKLGLDWRYRQRRGIQNLAYTPDGSSIWAATTEGVWVSRNGGSSWSQSLDVPMATSISIHPGQPTELLAACGGFDSAGKGIYRTTDDGQTWARMEQGVPAGFLGKIILDRAPSDPQVVYASVGHRNDAFGDTQEAITWLLRSGDGGSTWQIRNTTDYAAYQGWYSHFVKVFPDDADHVAVGGIALYESTDGGLTFDGPDYTIANGSSMTDMHAGYIRPGNDRVYIACDQGIFTSTDGDLYEWAMHGYQTTQFYRGTAQAQDNKDLMVGTPQDRLGTFYSGGEDWTPANIGHEGGHTIFKPGNSQTYLIAAAHLQYVALVTGGEVQDTFLPILGDPIEDLFTNTNFNAPIALAPSDGKVVYTARSILYRTTDFGTTWQARTQLDTLDGNPIGAIAVSHQDFNSLYLATSPRQGPMHLYRTTDGGESFTDITTGLPERWPTCIAVDPRNENTAYVTFSGFGTGHLFKTTDGGATWVDIDNGDLPDIPANAVFLDPDYPDHLYLATDLGVFVSLDGGIHWMVFDDGLPEAVFVMDFLTYRADRTLRLVTHGNGIYESKLLEPQTLPEVRTRLLYPWISNNEGLFESTLIANNLSGLPAEVRLTARRGDGETEEAVRQIAPGGMLTEKASSLFPQLGSGSGYSVVLETGNEGVFGRWVTSSLLAASGGSPSQGVAITMPQPGEIEDEHWGETLVFSYLPTTPDFLSAPVIVNLGGDPIDITLSFYDATGAKTAQTLLEDVPPLVPVAALASDFLPPGQEEAMMTAYAAGGTIAGVSFVFDDVFKETAIGNASSTSASSEQPSELVFPWVSNAENEYRSLVVLNNLSDQSQTVTLTARRENGEEETVNRDIPALGFWSRKAMRFSPSWAVDQALVSPYPPPAMPSTVHGCPEI